MGVRPQPSLRDVSAYRVPRHPAPVSLDLSGNLGPQVDPSIIRVSGSSLRSYPNAEPLEAALATRLGVLSAQVLVSAGADDAIDRICRAVLCPGRVAVVSEPGFEVTATRARLCGATVRAVPWPGGDFPVDAAIAIGAEASLVVVTSPNNPTGASVSPASLRRLSAALPDALLLVDLAYAEYDDADLTAVALSLPNTVVTRTLSKAWGLAGLRVGYAIGPSERIGWLRAAGLPYAVSQIALDTALQWLSVGEPVVQSHIEAVRATRDRISGVLSSLGADVVPSAANFVFARHPREAWLYDGLAGLGIGIRRFPGRPGLRLACPATPEDTERLLSGLRTVLSPEVIVRGDARDVPDLSLPVVTSPSGRRAWWLCHSAEEVQRARAAAAVPIAIGAALCGKGAARELDTIEAVEVLL